MAMADEERAMVTVTVMVMTRKVAAVSTHSESKVRSCLQRVSIHVKAEEYETETYQHRQGHPSDLQTIRTEASGIDGDVEGSSLKLQKSTKRQKSKRLTWNTPEPTRHTETRRNIAIGSLDPRVDMAPSRSSVSTTNQRETTKRLT